MSAEGHDDRRSLTKRRCFASHRPQAVDNVVTELGDGAASTHNDRHGCCACLLLDARSMSHLERQQVRQVALERDWLRLPLPQRLQRYLGHRLSTGRRCLYGAHRRAVLTHHLVALHNVLHHLEGSVGHEDGRVPRQAHDVDDNAVKLLLNLREERTTHWVNVPRQLQESLEGLGPLLVNFGAVAKEHVVGNVLLTLDTRKEGHAGDKFPQHEAKGVDVRLRPVRVHGDVLVGPSSQNLRR
mmetsp:Transcript_15361/g.47984  ORF Transcript_15361/g.47984 Transcript_15361/m.47984 type:complete len:241 (-) Transcript_15361:585-1307(-)